MLMRPYFSVFSSCVKFVGCVELLWWNQIEPCQTAHNNSFGTMSVRTWSVCQWVCRISTLTRLETYAISTSNIEAKMKPLSIERKGIIDVRNSNFFRLVNQILFNITHPYLNIFGCVFFLFRDEVIPQNLLSVTFIDENSYIG